MVLTSIVSCIFDRVEMCVSGKLIKKYHSLLVFLIILSFFLLRLHGITKASLGCLKKDYEIGSRLTFLMELEDLC